MNLLNRIFKKSTFPDIKYPIEEAFTIKGRTFYKFKSGLNIPYERALKTVLFYEEVRMKITFEYLEQHTKAIDKLLLSNKINIFDIKKLNDILKERLNLAFDTEILYKLASIVYFDENEDPRVYDFKHNADKIAFWKKNSSLKDFFLQTPILELMPFLANVQENLQSYSEIVQTLNKHHSEYISSILSTE